MISRRRACSARIPAEATAARRVRSGLVAVLVAAAGALTGVTAVLSAGPPAAGAAEPVSVGAGPVVPTQWPASYLAAPQIEGGPNTLRIYGRDRYQTSLAAALVLRGQGQPNGGFPFSTPDATSGGAVSLREASGWWGLGVCPRAIIVVAGDSPADALAASALSDSTGRSSEPYLQRSSAADPLFDPPGGFARVDTFGAPVLLTPSAREGATELAVATRLAAQDMRSGGCNTARQAIIVGGPAAVAPQIEAELVSIGYAEVFRVAGANRYGTAAAVAAALGTAAIPENVRQCADTSVTDGVAALGWYANSVAEFREAPDECRLLGRSVVLTDGIDGIDALAAGWWTSYWQVPVLLHDGTDRLPRETAAALSLLEIQNVIVVGGQERLSEQVAEQASQLARASTLRVAGADRYATSVAMAEHFGGWWPTGDGRDFTSSMACVVASSGSGQRVRGWADALGAGPWCGAASAAVGRGAPERMMPPVEIARPALVRAAGGGSAGGGTGSGSGSGSGDEAASRRPTRTAVPMLLVPAGAERLPDAVAAFLLDVFSAPDLCARQSASPDAAGSGSPNDPAAYALALANDVCPAPGFAVAFGGATSITPGMLNEISEAMAGDVSGSVGPAPLLVGAQTPDEFSPYGVQAAPGVPFGVGAFATALDMSPVFASGSADSASAAGSGDSDAASLQVCVPRRAYSGARWLLAEAPGTRAAAEISALGWYRRDADGVVRSAGRGAPACLRVGSADAVSAPLQARAVGPSGRSSDSLLLMAQTARQFSLAGPITARDPSRVGVPGEQDPATGGQTLWLFRTGSVEGQARLGNSFESVTSSEIFLQLQRGAGEVAAGRAVPDTFTADWQMRTAGGSLGGTAAGEALFRDGVWHLRGGSVLTEGSWASSVYGQPPEGVSDEGPTPVRVPREPIAALRVGTSDAYGAGGFVATLAAGIAGAEDDRISWQPEAFINAP